MNHLNIFFQFFNISTLGVSKYRTTYLVKYNNVNYALKIQHILPNDKNKSYKKELWRVLDLYDYINTLLRYKVPQNLRVIIQNIINAYGVKKYINIDTTFITENNLETVFNDIHCAYVYYINYTDATIQITTIKNRLNELFYQLSLSN